MKLFHNTVGGTYVVGANQSVSYTFPENAYIHLNGVNLSLAGLMVDCHGGTFTADETQFFSSVINNIPSEFPSIYNTNIVICDSRISGDGYPGFDDFQQYNRPYLSVNEFKSRQQKIAENHDHPDDRFLIETVAFFDKWADDNRQDIKNKIQAIVTKDIIFPKQLSILYDDRKIKHTTHIVLTYHALDKCSLTIDNTLSAAITFGSNSESIVKAKGLDLSTCKETISPIKPTFLALYNKATDRKPVLDLEFSQDVNQLFLKKIYQRMMTILTQQLGIPLTYVKIMHCNNQKNTLECVAYSLQNKLYFMQNDYEISDELPLNLGIRLRAEHVILSRLLQGADLIPCLDEQQCQQANISFPRQSWYTNYTEVCQQLAMRIKQLSLADLQRLHLALQIDDNLALSPIFEDILSETIQEKMSEESYVTIAPASLTATSADLLQTLMAPIVMYNKASHALFFSKPYANTDEGKALINQLSQSAL